MATEAATSGGAQALGGSPPAGWRVVATKEFADHISSVRFVILTLLVGLASLVSVYAAAGGIREVAEQASGAPALFLGLFVASPERIPAFFSLVGLLGPLLGIAFGFDAVNGERALGTLPRLVAQPIYRDDVINGKFVAGLGVVAMALGALTAIVSAVGLVRIGVVPSGAEVARLLAYLVVSVVYVGFWLALGTLFSVVVDRAATSALAAIAAWLVSTLFAGLLVGIVAGFLAPVPDQPTLDEAIRNARVEQNLGRLFPSTLYEEATIVLLRPEVRTLGIVLPQQADRAVPSQLSFDQSLLIVWPQVSILVALTVLCFAGAYVAFMRQEVRA